MIKHVLIGISGYSGVGKDEVAKVLVKNYQAFHTGLADPAKRHMADLYGFTETQLFGPSYERNKGDIRYPKSEFFRHELKSHKLSEYIPENLKGKKVYSFKVPGSEFLDFVEEGDPKFWLSPREALQRYCELMNDMYLDTWISKGIEIHKQLAKIVEDGNLNYRPYQYERMTGVTSIINPTSQPISEYIVTCFSDIRHKHEISYIRKQACENLIPIVIRIKRKSIPYPPFNHRSEMEQLSISDDTFDFIINNDGTLLNLEEAINHMMKIVKSDQFKPKTMKP